MHFILLLTSDLVLPTTFTTHYNNTRVVYNVHHTLLVLCTTHFTCWASLPSSPLTPHHHSPATSLAVTINHRQCHYHSLTRLLCITLTIISWRPHHRHHMPHQSRHHHIRLPVSSYVFPFPLTTHTFPLTTHTFPLTTHTRERPPHKGSSLNAA